jgi:hypothetical protein
LVQKWQQWAALLATCGTQIAFHAVPTLWLPQVTMTSCKFTGFRRVLHVRDKSKVTMKDCVVDLTMKGAYGGEGNGWPLVSNLMYITITMLGLYMSEWETRTAGMS